MSVRLQHYGRRRLRLPANNNKMMMSFFMGGSFLSLLDYVQVVGPRGHIQRPARFVLKSHFNRIR